ncbi:hypothetical protein RI065_00690 [Mycoplasmatota bacterium zrk1]
MSLTNDTERLFNVTQTDDVYKTFKTLNEVGISTCGNASSK